MQQLTQQLKSGYMEIREVPFPALSKGRILVRNHFSVISAGTEGKTVTDARKGYIAKARSRQKEVKQVIDMVKTNGLLPTYKLVMNKLEAPAALGYSTAGEVIAVADDVTAFKVGDRVASGGASASHADVVSVPVNLCAKVPENVSMDQAAFATIASIAMQGIRQANLRTGENCVIIGMGLIGQLTAKILEASGIKAIGVDVDEKQVEAARELGLKNVYKRDQTGLNEQIMSLTNGFGADAVVITAGTSSLDPVEFAGEIARKKAKVVIVGAVPTGFSRKNYYQKELDLRMSSSYGPGRYDLNYEEKGMDYPVGYVRFTEQRNMQTYLDLLAEEKIVTKDLISHTYDLPDAPQAYSMILERSEPFAGILIRYEEQQELKKDVQLKEGNFKPEEPNVGFIGAGNFAQNMLLPRMKGLCNFAAIATMQGNESVYVGEKYGFAKAYDDAEKVIGDPNVNSIFVVTRHDTHAEYVLQGVKAGKHVFTEKPLAMNVDELEEIRKAWEAGDGKHMMVGFNRRFSPAVEKVYAMLDKDQAKSINIRINAGAVPPEHWVNDPDIGGGRIIGEACHFVDLAMFLAGSEIVSVSAGAMEDPHQLNNTIVANFIFKNGSVASLSYFSNGNSNLPKESIEVFAGGTVARIDDFKLLTIYGSKVKKYKYKGDKGHAREMKVYLDSIREGKECPIPFAESYHSTLATFKVLQSLREKRTVRMN